MPESTMRQLTPTQMRIMDVLSDGLPHTREELHKCLYYEEGALSNIQPHLTYMRRILRPQGGDIICQRRDGDIYYIYVRLLANPYQG